MWQSESSKEFSSFEDAEAYIKGLNLGGYTDWRFPTKDELYTLGYLFDLKAGIDCPMKLKGSFWNKNGKGEAGEWFSYPLCGGSDFKYIRSTKGRVRAVRP
jgi:hypothetical protein